MKETVIGWLKERAFDWAKDQIASRTSEQEIRSALNAFIERENKVNELCSIAEEIDFEGVCKYVQSDEFRVDIERRLLSGSKKERGIARKTIEQKAYAYGGAQTDEARKRVSRFVSLATDILRSFYEKELGKGDLLSIAYIQDCVSEVGEKVDELTEKVEALSEYSLDHVLDMVKKGQFDEISGRTDRMLRAMSTEHPLFPDYGYGFTHDYGKTQLISMPLSDEAERKHPPIFRFDGVAKVGDIEVRKLTKDMLDYAYRHQLRITLSIEKAIKYLGSRMDSVQVEAEALVGKEISIDPRPFPPGFPCSISLDDEVMYDYVVLRTKEILDDGTYVITNDEQENATIRIQMEARMDGTLPKIVFSQRGERHCDRLQFAKFTNKATKGAVCSIKILSLGEPLLTGILDKTEKKMSTGFDSLEEEIEFLEQLAVVEDYIGRELDTSKGITLSEMHMVAAFANLLNGNQNEYRGSDFEIKVAFSENLRNMIVEKQNKPFFFTYVGTAIVPVFDAEVEIPFVRHYVGVRFKNPEKMKKLASALDIGDPIKVEYEATEKAMVYDRMVSSEFIQGLKDDGLIPT